MDLKNNLVYTRSSLPGLRQLSRADTTVLSLRDEKAVSASAHELDTYYDYKVGRSRRRSWSGWA
jgi:hypothetical protein